MSDWRANYDVVLPGVAIEKRFERRQQGHEDGHARSAAEAFERLGQASGDCKGLAGARVSMHWWPCPISGQLQCRGAPVKLSSPVGELLFQHATLKPLPLPGCEVGILDR